MSLLKIDLFNTCIELEQGVRLEKGNQKQGVAVLMADYILPISN